MLLAENIQRKVDIGMSDSLKEKSKSERFCGICSDLHNLYMAKNARYKDSFSESFKDYGIVVSAIREQDKVNRLKYLVTNTQDSGGDESIVDTLKDIANYAIMTLMELEAEGKWYPYSENIPDSNQCSGQRNRLEEAAVANGGTLPLPIRYKEQCGRDI